ncbi:MAG: hypothetical protein LQ339_000110 [Xanthoria mediterranea]|nr:MAG: hypothetical protein LQ339_000110 [Xanthoria mediterranea]
MSQLSGQQHAPRGRSGQRSFAPSQPSSSRYPNSALRRDGSSDWSQLVTPIGPPTGFSHHPPSVAITPSSRVHRDLAEQSAYGATSGMAWNEHQSSYQSRRAAEVVARPEPPLDGLSAALERQRSINDPVNELKELRHKYKHLKTRYFEVESQRDTYIKERDHYQQQVGEQAKRSRALEEEVAQLKREIQSQEPRHKALEQDFRAMNDELNRARATIKIQGETIEGRVDTTLVKKSTDLALRQQPPPSPLAMRFGENYGFGIKSALTRNPGDRHDPRETLYEPEPAQQRHLGAGSSKADLATSTSLTIRPREAKLEFPWASQLSALFLRIEQYCKTYLDHVIQEADDEWPQKLAHDVVEESDVHHVKAMAADHRVRHLLLSRFIVGWIANRYFHSRIARGFSRETDEKVQATRRQTRPDNPVDLVRALAQAEAKTIEEITLAPGFDSWRAGQIRLGVDTMATRLQEAIVPGATSPPLDKALESILADGWRVGFRMATCTDQFAIRFPTATPSTKFDPRVMLNRDPYITGPPTELENRGARVALGITPHITVKDLLAAKMEERSVHLANVLLSWRRERDD